MIAKKQKVIIIQKVFANYRKPVYDQLSEQLDLKVLYGKNNSGVKTMDAEYANSVPSIQYWNKESAVLLFPLWRIYRYYPEVVLCDLALGMLNLPLIILGCRLLGIKFAFWSHGYNRKTGFHPDKSWKDKYRLWLLNCADANILYGKIDQEILRDYLPEEKIFVAQNTMDIPTLTRINRRLEEEGSDSIKRRLGVEHLFNMVYIGRLLPSKKPNLLVDIYTILKTQYGLTMGVHFIGDGKILPVIKERVSAQFALEDFYFHGAIHDNKKSGELLFINDLMVLPGALGLSVNHAFCFGCPVISFKRKDGFPGHGPEVEYVIHNQTGFLVEEHSPEAMAAMIHEYLTNPKLKKELKKNIQMAVESVFPLEKMVNGAMECVNYLTDNIVLNEINHY